jgi:putative peptidoglycan lipid II flippase
VGAATLASRILGYLRDAVVARAFGAGPLTDAFFVAFRLPNLLRRLVGEGALSSAFIPVFTEYVATRPRAETLRMFRAVAGAMVGVLALVTVVGILVAPVLVRVMAPGFFTGGTTGILAVRLTRWMFPYLFFVGLAALAMGFLNAHRHFLTPALAPTMLNLAMIASVLGLVPHLAEPVLGLAAGVLAGGAGQLAIQLPVLIRRGILVAPSLDLRHPAIRRTLERLAPVAVGQSAAQLNILVDTIIASLLTGGSVSYLYYADRLMEFPLGVAGIAMATAALPTLSEQAARGEHAALCETFTFTLRLCNFLMAPAAVGFLLLGEPMVRVLYQRGEFGPLETAGTVWALGFYALGLPGFAAAKIGAQAFYALGDTQTPVRVAISAMGLNSVLAIVLAFPLGHGGLALATSCSGTANAVSLAWLLRRRLGPKVLAGLGSGLGRAAIASAALALAVAGASWRWPPPVDRGAEAVWLGAMIAGGVLTYAATHRAMTSPELEALWQTLRRRLRD